MEEKELVPITIISKNGQSALVEWNDGERLRRAYVPVAEIEGDKCDEYVLSAGIQYGAEWEQYLSGVTVSPETVADTLRSHGYWTPEDIERNVTRAQSIINMLLGINAALLARWARNDK